MVSKHLSCLFWAQSTSIVLSLQHKILVKYTQSDLILVIWLALTALTTFTGFLGQTYFHRLGLDSALVWRDRLQSLLSTMGMSPNWYLPHYIKPLTFKVIPKSAFSVIAIIFQIQLSFKYVFKGCICLRAAWFEPCLNCMSSLESF